MSVKLDNANLEVHCECTCNCGKSEYLGPLDWSWDGPGGFEMDHAGMDGEIEGMGYEDVDGAWLCSDCAETAKENHGG